MVSNRRRIRRRERGRNTRRKRRSSGRGNYDRGRGQDLRVLTTGMHPALTDELHHHTTAILGQDGHRALGIAHPMVVAVAVQSHDIVAGRTAMAEKGMSRMTMAEYEYTHVPLTPQMREIEAGAGVLVDTANGNAAGAGVLITTLANALGIVHHLNHAHHLLRVHNTKMVEAANPNRTTPMTAPPVLLP